ncbi:MAG: IPT/TIG domain-containing protein, partial [Acidobacteria bacterium]|nr:IPT/TIG domain-containing protein [Acidobacteriota bacterium]
IGVDNASFGLLVLRKITNPGATPSISGNINITVPTTTSPIPVPHPASTCPLDALDDRLFVAKSSRGVMTTAHNIQVSSSGVASGSGNRNGSRWYQLGNLDTTPTLLQSGTLFDSAATQPRSYFIPSAARSGQGHMALGASVAGANIQAGAAVAGRFASDTTGTIQAPTVAQAGAANYNVQVCDADTPSQRWGDYTQTSVDPADDMTMWTFQQYVHTANGYAVRVIQLLAPPPATPSSASPSTLQQGATNVNVVVTGTASGANAYFDPGAGFPNRIAASVSGSGVTVNSVTVTDATHLTLNVTVAAAAATGARNITITNPDGQSATSIGTPLSIVPCPAPSGATTGAATVCTNSTGNTATATETGATYAWSITNGTITAGATSQTVTYSTGGTSPVILGLTVTKNGCVATGGKTVTVANRPIASATGGGTICTGGSIALQGNGATNCSWSPSTGLSNALSCTPMASPASTQVYSLTVTDANGCASTNSSQVTVGVNTRPTAVATGSATICAGTSTLLQGSGGTACSWSPAAGLSNASICNPQASPTTTSTYTLTVTGANGCASTNGPQVTVSVTPRPSAPVISGSSSACIGAPFSLSATPGYSSYQWLRNGNPIAGANAATYGKASAAAGDAGTYTVTGTLSGCVSNASTGFGLSVSTCQGPAPTVATVVPPCASVSGGRSVVLTGTNFQAGATVTLAGTPATVTAQTATSLTVTAGSRAAAPVVLGAVQVTNPDNGTVVLPSAFTYAVRGDANNNGAITGADTFFLNLAVFLGGTQPATLCNGDANGNGATTAADTFFLNLYVFLGGPAPGP